jgi:hypothetical protein
MTDIFEKLQQKIAQTRRVSSDKALARAKPTIQDMSNEAGVGSSKSDIQDAEDGGARATLIVKFRYKPILKVFIPRGLSYSAKVILTDYIALREYFSDTNLDV